MLLKDAREQSNILLMNDLTQIIYAIIEDVQETVIVDNIDKVLLA
jgi:hypothetical protein